MVITLANGFRKPVEPTVSHDKLKRIEHPDFVLIQLR